jgi:hypothetical protein
MLGKLPARPGAVKLKFSTYVDTDVLAEPPAEFGHDNLVGDWGILANDRVGCCAISDSLHQHLLWNAEVGKAIPLSDAVAIKNYSAVTGYDPADPSTDQGTAVPELIHYRYTKGLIDGGGKRHKIGAALELEPGNWEQLRYAMYYFDGVTLGIQMSKQWMDAFQNGEYVWDKVSRPKIIGGHAITGVAVHGGNARIITWGTDVVGVTQAGYEQFSDETYAFFGEEKLNNGVDINGFDKEKLLADLHLLNDIE